MIKFLRFKILRTNIFKVLPKLRDWQKDDKLHMGRREFLFQGLHPGAIIATVHHFKDLDLPFGTYVELYPYQRIVNASLAEREAEAAKTRRLVELLLQNSRLKSVATQYQDPLRRELLIAQSKGED